MRNLYLKIRFFFLALFRKTQSHSLAYKKGWKLVFEENWHEWQDRWTVGGSALYHPGRLNVHYVAPEIRDGCGVFFVKYQPKQLYVYQTGKYNVFDYAASKLRSKLYQKYGRFECRMTIPKGKWCWPAFWL